MEQVGVLTGKGCGLISAAALAGEGQRGFADGTHPIVGGTIVSDSGGATILVAVVVGCEEEAEE